LSLTFHLTIYYFSFHAADTGRKRGGGVTPVWTVFHLYNYIFYVPEMRWHRDCLNNFGEGRRSRDVPQCGLTVRDKIGAYVGPTQAAPLCLCVTHPNGTRGNSAGIASKCLCLKTTPMPLATSMTLTSIFHGFIYAHSRVDE
jgi:hypothetical protein